MRLGEGERRPAEIAEDERGSGIGRLLQSVDGGIQNEESLGGRLEFDEQQGEAKLQENAAEDDAPWRRPAVFAQAPSNAEQGEKPQNAVQDR